jgi:hypothetical protein
MLRKLFGGESKTKDEAHEIEAPPCPHTALVPRWDNLEDMGKQDKATSFHCQGCDQVFTAEEAQPYLP